MKNDIVRRHQSNICRIQKKSSEHKSETSKTPKNFNDAEKVYEFFMFAEILQNHRIPSFKFSLKNLFAFMIILLGYCLREDSNHRIF